MGEKPPFCKNRQKDKQKIKNQELIRSEGFIALPLGRY
jgi:hypothetical protein